VAGGLRCMMHMHGWLPGAARRARGGGCLRCCWLASRLMPHASCLMHHASLPASSSQPRPQNPGESAAGKHWFE